MKIVKTTLLLLVLAILIGCTNDKNTGGIEQFQQKQQNQNPALTELSDCTDSIQSLNSEIGLLLDNLESLKERIDFLKIKKDSLQNSLKQIKISITQLNSGKIEPGINGVNAKLDELKGQKENLQEQQELQKQEIVLAEKKMELLKEEEIVYVAQRKALWDKGAPPDDFKKVDSLLNSINKNISKQTSLIKNLKRNVGNIEEQVNSINQQRNSLSSKIRDNYTAQKIFEEYSVEEEKRLADKIKVIDEELELLLANEHELSIEISAQTGEKKYFQIKQNEIQDIKSAVEAKQKEESLAKIQLEAQKNKKRSRITGAFIAIIISGIVLISLFFVGKSRKLGKLKK